MAKTPKGATLPQFDPASFEVTSSRHLARDRALLISGPLRAQASPELRDFFADDADLGVTVKGNTVEFRSPDHAAIALLVAELAQIITHDEALQLIREASQELAISKRAVLIKNIGSRGT